MRTCVRGTTRKQDEAAARDMRVNHPPHYTEHLWRCDGKDDPIEDLKKSRWYIDREIARRGG